MSTLEMTYTLELTYNELKILNRAIRWGYGDAIWFDKTDPPENWEVWDKREKFLDSVGKKIEELLKGKCKNANLEAK